MTVPMSIDPGLAPGGIVFDAYASGDGRLLVRSPVVSLEGVDEIAEADRERAEAMLRDGEYCMLAAYDGDTGQPMPIIAALLEALAEERS